MGVITVGLLGGSINGSLKTVKSKPANKSKPHVSVLFELAVLLIILIELVLSQLLVKTVYVTVWS